jgi:cyclase
MRLKRAKLFGILVGAILSGSIVTRAQSPAPAPAAAPPRDYSKVEIKANKISDSFYTLDGDGGTIGVLIGPDGVFMVDSQRAQLTDKIAAAIKQLTNSPIRFLVLTHDHADHTGGVENFAKMGVTIIARNEVRKRMADGTVAPGLAPAAAGALPVITIEGRTTFHLDGEDVQLIPIANAHTDGDTIVWFPKNNVIMCGDFYRSAGYPNIDRLGGGSVTGMIEGLTYLASIAGPNTKIVPGHGASVTRDAILAQRDLIVDVRDRVSQLVANGKSEQEVVSAHVTAEYDAKVPQAADTADRFVRQVYGEQKSRVGGQ